MSRRVQDVQGEAFSAERMDATVVLRFGQHQMVLAASLAMVEELMAYLAVADADASVKSIVAVGSPDDSGEQEYDRFLEQALAPGRGEVLLKRMFHAFDQFLLWAVSCRKMVVCAARGVVLMDYLGLMLACDHGVYADNVTVANSHLKHGLVPKAGAALLLTERIGKAGAYELLLSEAAIPVSRLVDLGIAGHVVPIDQVEQAAIEKAQEFAKVDARSLWGVKGLVNYAQRDLASYLAHENAVLDRLTMRMLHE